MVQRIRPHLQLVVTMIRSADLRIVAIGAAAAAMVASLTGCAPRSLIDVKDVMATLSVLTSDSVIDQTETRCGEGMPCVQAFTSDELTLWRFANTSQAESFAYGLESAGASAYLSDYIVAQYISDDLTELDRRTVEEVLDGAHASE